MHRPSLLPANQADVLNVLYPWYKEEVFRRREQMVRLTAFACTLLATLLVSMLAIPISFAPSPIRSVLAITGICLFSGLFAYFILQQRARHTMAKQTLIEIERALGLYEEGLYREDTTLYPTQWQSDWTRDYSINVYLTVLFSLTLLVIAAIFI